MDPGAFQVEIPDGYTFFEQRFIKAVNAARRNWSVDGDKGIRLDEWARKVGTYHAKGSLFIVVSQSIQFITNRIPLSPSTDQFRLAAFTALMNRCSRRVYPSGIRPERAPGSIKPVRLRQINQATAV